MIQPRRTNRRTHATRARFRDALLALAAERPFAEIDVADIARVAGLNRTTFYLHYKDKDVLIAGVLAQLLDEVSAGGRALSEAEDPAGARFEPSWHDTLFRRIGERADLYRRLFAQSGPGTFPDRLLDLHEARITDLWDRLGYPETPAGPPRRVRARFVAAGIQGVIRLWLESGLQESPDLLSDWAWALTFPRHEPERPRNDGRQEQGKA